MGYYQLSSGISGITCFKPDDTDTEFYIPTRYTKVSLTDILEKAKEKWPDITFEELNIEAEYIHTDCVGYDLYDPQDYTEYLCISREKPLTN